MTGIAVVGMACRYPDATTPQELWENAVAGRRAFRRLPDERMRLSDYWDADPMAPDKFYARNAAVIEGYEFDRIAYKVAGSTYRSTDLTHWLALDTAATALADAGYPMAEGLPRERTGVVVGNTLTGEFSRANTLRLRWPYVRRMIAAALKERDWDDQTLASFLDDFEEAYKSPFPAVDEDTLAGGLANTIAGRICNYFDLKGGGYTVDGACSSSLLSVATACKGLIDGDLDVAVAGGVDLSIDPFEIIGFAKTGALATGEMRLYDRGSNGFWPGEGCGMVVLMRESEARESGRRVYATIAGWGISSDGKGGITRPEVDGYQLALKRAYARAGFGIETVALFEGHGTGTKVGDKTELTALALARTTADPSAPPAAITSIKGMIGHTKAAAGVAGLIKAVMAVHHEVLPPTIGCFDPHEVLTADGAALRPLRKAEPFPTPGPVRAGVTAMGFGGINTHIVVENSRPRRRVRFDTRTRALAASFQDTELLLVDAFTAAELRERLERLVSFVPRVAYAELSDLAAELHRELRDLPWRAAVVVSSPEDAEQKLRRICAALDAGESRLFNPEGSVFLGSTTRPGRVGFLFPGQGSGRGTSGGALRRRFAEAEEVYEAAALPVVGDMIATEVAQPRIVTGSMAGVRVLSMLGIEASLAVGHSLGEISALQWAGAMDEHTVLDVAALRGRTMSQHSASGTMASISAPPEVVDGLLTSTSVVIGGYNGPNQTVVAGTLDEIGEVCRRAVTAGLGAAELKVSHAFHSPLVAPAADAFADALPADRFGPVDRRIISTVTGETLAQDTDIVELLRRQITAPVLFAQAVALAAKDVDLMIEVGPGRVLSGLTTACTELSAVALDTDDESLAGLLRVVGAAFVTGVASVDSALFHGRLIRPLRVGTEFRFFASPCEAAPPLQLRSGPKKTTAGANGAVVDLGATLTATVAPPATAAPAVGADVSAAVLLRRLAAERAELPLELVHEGSRLLDDLHLSSITVGQVVNQVAQALGIPPAQAPTNFATATVKELADALDTLATTATSGEPAVAAIVAGVGDWSRAWFVDLDDVALPARPGLGAASEASGSWQVFAEPNDPLAEPLRHALARAGVGGGVLVCLPENCPPERLELALSGAKTVLSAAPAAGSGGPRFVLVQGRRGAAGMAKTLHLEAPHIRTTVVHAPRNESTMDRVLAEVAATTAFSEVYYEANGTRRVPTLRVMPVRAGRHVAALTDRDVLLVTGGGKGITAECALAMATDSGAALALLGRSDQAADPELSANLARIEQAGIRVRYARADVTDAAQVAAAVADLTAALGPITAVLHGAGRNEPRGITSLDLAAIARTFAPKVDGLRHVLAAIDVSKLRLLVSLGSIIGRAGLRGEADYATANEWLAELTREVGEANPACRTLCLEWSVWSGVGMGERLSVVESLARDGVTAITPDQGIAILRRLLADPGTPEVVVISGRTEGIHTVRYDLPALPLLRFVERPLIRYHGVELVTEVELNAGTDQYLADHLLDRNLLLPAVFGMEAMAQVASAVTGNTGVPVIEQAEFLRPIVVPPGGSTRIRVAALVVDDGVVDMVIRSEETAYAAEHFRARLSYLDKEAPAGPPDQVSDALEPVKLDPATELYGDTLFQGGRFHRLRSYHRAAARHVDVEVAAIGTVPWFAGYLPDTLLLGDPGVRDALMHGNQVCVPDATLLPQGIERLYPAGPRMSGDQDLRYCATERSRDGDTYVYDIALRTTSGEVVERWEGLRLRAVRKKDGRGPWVAPLLGSYLERTLGDLVGASVAVAVEPDGPTVPGRTDPVQTRRAQTTLAASRALGEPATVAYRPDGKPELAAVGNIPVSERSEPRSANVGISAAHGAGVTLCVAASGALGCDVETVVARDEPTWRGLLGARTNVAELVASTTGESFDTAATRVWAAAECLTKAGSSPSAPLMVLPSDRDGWTVFGSGELRVVTLATTLRDVAESVVFAIATTGVA
jgi:enediyne polyketide synthase